MRKEGSLEIIKLSYTREEVEEIIDKTMRPLSNYTKKSDTDTWIKNWIDMIL